MGTSCSFRDQDSYFFADRRQGIVYECAVIQDLLPVASSTGHFYGMRTARQVIDARVSKIGQLDEKPVFRAQLRSRLESAVA
jgi:hypothetical protein